MNEQNKKVPTVRFKGFTNDWEQHKLGEISFKVNTKNKENLTLPVLSNSAEYGIVNQEDYFDKKIANRTDNYYIVKHNDFVYNPRISKKAPYGPIRRNTLDTKGLMSPLYYVFRINDGNYIYLDYYFKSSKWYKFMYQNGDSGARSDRFAIKDKIFQMMPISMPNTKEQNKIGQLIQTLQKLIDLQQRKLDLLKQLKKGLLQKMFAEKNNKQPVLRFKGFHDDWEQRKLGEIVEWSKGSGLSKDALNIQGIGVPVIHYADLYKFNSVQKEVIHWTMNDIGTKIPENNLLFPMSDVTPDGLARTSTVLQSNVKAGGDVLIAKLNKDILSTFMSYQINRNKNQILPLVTGTTVRHINSKSLSTLKVTVPGKNEQKYVGSILMRFDSLIALHQRKQNHLKLLKKSLLQQMFM